MKHIFLNLKRFDVPVQMGGVNRYEPVRAWGRWVVECTQDALAQYQNEETEFMMFFPEAHLIPALDALRPGSNLQIGCQGVFRQDTAPGGNFGAFTTNRTAHAVRALGCNGALIGHCEERKDKLEIMQAANAASPSAVNELLNQEVRAALDAGLSVLYCIGENAEEQPRWQEVLQTQIEEGLSGVDKSRVTIAYEPVWAIGPGKTPPDRAAIERTAAFIKQISGGMDVVYGGGLKADNAEMLASIPQIDGGLIALTRFSGDIGFYPEEYLEIIRLYLGG